MPSPPPPLAAPALSMPSPPPLAAPALCMPLAAAGSGSSGQQQHRRRLRDWRSLSAVSHLRWALSRVVRLDTHCLLSLPIFFALLSILLVEFFLYVAVKLSVKFCEEAYFRCVTKVVVVAGSRDAYRNSGVCCSEGADEGRRGGCDGGGGGGQKRKRGGRGGTELEKNSPKNMNNQYRSTPAPQRTSPTHPHKRTTSPATNSKSSTFSSSLFSLLLSPLLATPSGLISLRALKRRMFRCTTYGRYFSCVEQLDVLTGRSEWKHQLSSTSYDYPTVAKRKELLQYRRLSRDVAGVVAVLRTCVDGQFGGIFRESLYSRTFAGTKKLVEEYVDEVCVCLQYLQQYVTEQHNNTQQATSSGGGGRKYEREGGDSWRDVAEVLCAGDEHIDRIACTQEGAPPHSTTTGATSGVACHADSIRSMLHDGTCQWGCTALILSGGAMLGMHHFGLCETLLQVGADNRKRAGGGCSDSVMPNVVCGTSAGAVVAAWLCTHTEEELLKEINAEHISKAFAALRPNNWFHRLWRILRVGYMCDVPHWTKQARRLYGDLTFLEAYEKTGKVLNICMTRAEGGDGSPLLLHYKNAPNVAIYSAVLCSSSFPFLAYPLQLKEKCEDGELVESCEFEGSFYHDGSLSGDIPISQLRECWGVTFTIVSQVNPHIFPFCGLRAHGEAGAPVAWRGAAGRWRAGFIMSGLELFFKENMRFLLRLIALLDVSPTYRGINCGALALQSYGGDVTIHPRSLSWRHSRLANDLTESEVEWYIQEGRIMTYPKMSLIINRMRIERALERLHLAAFEPIFAEATSTAHRKGVDCTPSGYSVVEQRTFQLLGRLYNYRESKDQRRGDKAEISFGQEYPTTRSRQSASRAMAGVGGAV
eukprot:GHVS01072328.1.p1 GENE.GHVS01072328.1~~GHVS01072328.1.p1  ORF type:complete len:872 (-),score=191.14 GHVS01072328.1:466-3081(-)